MKSALFLLVVSVLASCSSAGSAAQTPEDFALAYLRGIGDAAMRTYGTEAIKKYAPEAMMVLDLQPADGIVTIDEFTATFASGMTPEKATWLTLVALEVFQAKHKEGH